MRGGITSGIVYPRAIAKLAETYDFRSIGGTSAGAIAAAATAAAAFGAKNGTGHFQTRFKGLPGELAEIKDGKSVLERLFQPQAETRNLFSVLMAALEPEPTARKLVRIAKALCAGYWPYALAGAAVALLPAVIAGLAVGNGGWSFVALVVAALVPAFPLALLGAAIGVGLDALQRLPKTGYGLCPGSSNRNKDAAGIVPLTDWLHEFFQDVANRPLDKPVTFGDLWGKRDPTKERDIELVLMTTNVTRGVSHRFPFLEGSWGQLFFNKDEFAKLFPNSVVRCLTDPEQKPGDSACRGRRGAGGFLPAAQACGPAHPARCPHEFELSLFAQRRTALCGQCDATKQGGQIRA